MYTKRDFSNTDTKTILVKMTIEQHTALKCASNTHKRSMAQLIRDYVESLRGKQNESNN